MDVYTKQTNFGTFRSDRPPTFMRGLFTATSVFGYVCAVICFLVLVEDSFLVGLILGLFVAGMGLLFEIPKKKLNAAYQKFLDEVEEQRKKENEQIENEARKRDEAFLANHPDHKKKKTAEQIRTIRLLTDIRDMCKEYTESSDAYFDHDEFTSLCEQLGVMQYDDCEEIIALRDEIDELVELCDQKEERMNRKNSEHRMRCNVCGHVYCYTDKDVRENDGNTLLSGISAIGSLAAALGGGTRLDAYAQQNNANRYSDKVIDFKRCPHCNSTDVEPFDGESNAQQDASQSVVSSAADELKKFKELLDMGVITQEEFDAKKKQLLGL